MSADYIYNHERFEIYQLSRKLIKITYELVEKFPDSEKYNLTSQSRRAVVSICLNITEGNSKYYKKEQARYADNALASLMELKACIAIAIDLKYIKKSDTEKFDALVKELYFKAIAYKKSKMK